MVDFTPSVERVSLRELVHDFAASEPRPVARDNDRDGTWPQSIIDRHGRSACSTARSRRLSGVTARPRRRMRFAADTAMTVATDAVRVCDRYGFIEEYPGRS